MGVVYDKSSNTSNSSSQAVKQVKHVSVVQGLSLDDGPKRREYDLIFSDFPPNMTGLFAHAEFYLCGSLKEKRGFQGGQTEKRPGQGYSSAVHALS